MKSWKQAEYQAAKALGGKRIPLSGGRGSEPQGDIALPGWLVEVKYRKKFGVWSMFREVERKARKAGKNALLILKEHNMPGELAVMRVRFFREAPSTGLIASQLLDTCDSEVTFYDNDGVPILRIPPHWKGYLVFQRVEDAKRID